MAVVTGGEDPTALIGFGGAVGVGFYVFGPGREGFGGVVIGVVAAIHFGGPECGPDVQPQRAVGRDSQADIAVVERRIVDGLRAGPSVAVVGGDRAGKSLLIRSLAGLIKPKNGMAQIGGFDAQRAALAGSGRFVGFASRDEIFHASIDENVDVGRTFIGNNRVREALVQVGLWDTVMRLPDGLRTMLQSNAQKAQLIIARAIAGNPSLLLIDSLLDDLTPETRATLWETLAAPDAPWTLILVTNHRTIAELCDRQLELKGS